MPRITWRDRYRPLIGDIIGKLGTEDMRSVRRALRLAFPGPRAYFCLRIWRDECRVQLGLKVKKPPRNLRPDPNQKDLF
ncbi:hypothetical protein C5Y96_05800 [Blastopirellula marina]|uniref:Uncharacterized protein n=1 Tax=Blastopirellula marina TaxID=124 RepID=A0A2S8G4K4_9BACT|nr:MULTISPECIES: hypothetical protein [Pirellulaceae]PQO39367.1 hypothetical protein C5Y96_05800 [Blastopirellula marina]RCS55675.1 hypothetical protein DTL36_05810 [Bremerella cremea]